MQKAKETFFRAKRMLNSCHGSVWMDFLCPFFIVLFVHVLGGGGVLVSLSRGGAWAGMLKEIRPGVKSPK